VWPIVLVAGLALGLGGGVFAVIYSGGLAAVTGGGAVGAVPSISADAAAGDVVAKDAALATVTGHAALDAASDAAPGADAALDADAAIAATAPVAVDAGVPAKTAPDNVKLSFATKPAGATVLAPDGKELGVTPLEIVWSPSKTPVQFSLRMKGYATKKKLVVVDSEQVVECELAKVAPTTVPKAKDPKDTATARPPELNGSGLERPD
jgi:hypothetical protein